MPVRWIKMQVFGGVLFCLGAVTALLAGIIGFELDIFYVAISIIGAGLFLYGAVQKNRHDGGRLCGPGAQQARQVATKKPNNALNGD